jgi:hypothetical protein
VAAVPGAPSLAAVGDIALWSRTARPTCPLIAPPTGPSRAARSIPRNCRRHDSDRPSASGWKIADVRLMRCTDREGGEGLRMEGCDWWRRRAGNQRLSRVVDPDNE